MYVITKKDAALVPIRATLGASMLYHGLPKIGGEGAAQTGQMFDQLGIRPGGTWARMTGLAEVFAGATALVGFATRLGALAVLTTQVVAVSKVHAGKGFSNTSGGYEFNLALMAMALGLFVSGPGAISLHEVVERGVKRRPWLLARRRRRRAFSTAMLLK